MVRTVGPFRVLSLLSFPIALTSLLIGGIPANPSPLDDLYNQAYKILQAGRYHEAARQFEEGAERAEKAGNINLAFRFWNGAGASNHSMGRYAEALTSYNKAIDAANRAGQKEAAGAISINVATVYLFLGDLDAAGLTLRKARGEIPEKGKLIPQLLLQEAQVQAKRGELQKAEQTVRQAAELSFDLDLPRQALPWEKLGWILLAENRIEEAEGAFTEAYRLTLMRKEEMAPAIYQGLGRVRMEQNRPREAKLLLDRALEVATKGANRTPLWYLYQARGRAQEAIGDNEGALADYRKAVVLARLWKGGVLPATWMQTASDAGVSSLSSDLAELIQKMSPERQDLVAEAFVEVEDSKANSLRMLTLAGARVRPERKADYGEIRAKLSDALFRSLQTGQEWESGEVRDLRARLAVLEAEAAFSAGWRDPEVDGPPVARLRAIQRRLGAHRVLLSFHVGESRSALWVVTADAFQMLSLPGSGEIERSVEDELTAIREGGDRARPFSALLFKHLPPSILAKTDWVLSLDGPLFNLPWPALRLREGTGTRYLVERQSLQTVPSALFLTVATPAEARDGKPPSKLVAVADPIYNRADSRWGGKREPMSMSINIDGGTLPNIIEFARLNATAWEVESVRRATRDWISEMVVLEGRQASPEELGKVLAQPVSILHFATHVVASPQRGGTLLLMPEADSPGTRRGAATAQPAEVLIALSMDEVQKIKFLSISEIISSKFQLPGSLVVLNGCSSGVGAVLPGAGLLGLSRAWMTVGARAVVASRWATLDEEGKFFEVFYRELGHPEQVRGSSVARALGRTQRTMLQGGGWRSEPGYWATYFSVGRDYVSDAGSH